jgi:hypothetical protein
MNVEKVINIRQKSRERILLLFLLYLISNPVHWAFGEHAEVFQFGAHAHH